MPAPDFDEVVYPESDGLPMAEGDVQGNVIRTLMAGYRYLYRDAPDVHVSGDMFWYPERGNNREVTAPDVMVIDGCPRDRELPSYLPWEHEGRPPRLVIEVLSPSNRPTEMIDKQAFYDRHGVEEYVYIDPFDCQVRAWVRAGGTLVTQLIPARWTSVTSGVTFGFEDGEFVAVGPEGRRWLRPEDEMARAETEAARAETEAARAETEAARADRAEAEARRLVEELERLRGSGPPVVPYRP